MNVTVKETEEPSAGILVKISRNGERFWLRNVRELDGRHYGNVDNHLVVNNYGLGELIEFDPDEVVQTWKDDYQRQWGEGTKIV